MNFSSPATPPASSASPQAACRWQAVVKDVDDAFRWFLRKSGGGDVVILRASGSDGYNQYIRNLDPIDLVESIVIKSRAAASDPFVLDKVRKAEAIFIAGGGQWNCVRYWKGTPSPPSTTR